MHDATELIRLTPGRFNGYRLRGSVYENKGEKAKADADFAKANRIEGSLG